MNNIERINLTEDYNISRIIKGGWQLAGGHGAIDKAEAITDMRKFVEAGITTFDCADIYTGVEELIGEFIHSNRNSLGKTLPQVQIHTKFVPDLGMLAQMTPEYIEGIIDRSLNRLQVDQVDLVQFHWWDYDVPGYVETSLELKKLQQKGKIRNLALTNFDVIRIKEMVQAGVKFVSNQVQYSVLDQRPEHGMTEFCEQQKMKLLCYGTVAGGLISEKYIGRPALELPHENRSITKYNLIIEEFGGWDAYQNLLILMQKIARKRGTSISNVASRYVLQKPKVAAVIVGARNSSHLEDNLELFKFELDEEDLEKISEITVNAPGPKGDIYDLERVKGGKHAGIMKYDLNKK